MGRSTKYQATCPKDVCAGKCGGEQVVWTFAKTATVAPCSALIAQGWNTKVQMAFYLTDEEAVSAKFTGVAL